MSFSASSIFTISGSHRSLYLNGHPPTGVPTAEAEIGSMLMYYGGDLVDAVLFFILCMQWFKTARPRMISVAKVFQQ
ncbi:hypothetical protein [Anaerobacillus alkaliphilus]|uniref:hypothetical protein n=1 Tax=Anaerobacillus alkaliphilus TaxID=1548597 RepID=UPI00100BAA70